VRLRCCLQGLASVGPAADVPDPATTLVCRCWQCQPASSLPWPGQGPADGYSLGLWGQCGGRGGNCASFSCVDGPFPDLTCPAGSSCQRESEWSVICASKSSCELLWPSCERRRRRLTSHYLAACRYFQCRPASNYSSSNGTAGGGGGAAAGGGSTADGGSDADGIATAFPATMTMPQALAEQVNVSKLAAALQELLAADGVFTRVTARVAGAASAPNPGARRLRLDEEYTAVNLIIQLMAREGNVSPAVARERLAAFNSRDKYREMIRRAVPPSLWASGGLEEMVWRVLIVVKSPIHTICAGGYMLAQHGDQALTKGQAEAFCRSEHNDEATLPRADDPRVLQGLTTLLTRTPVGVVYAPPPTPHHHPAVLLPVLLWSLQLPPCHPARP
jgi:hypothetical protein